MIILLILFLLLVSSCSKVIEEQERVPVVVLSSLLIEETKTKSEDTNTLMLDTICDDIHIQVECLATKRKAETYPPKSKTSWGNTSLNTLWTINDDIGIYMMRSTGIPDTLIDINNSKYRALKSGSSSSFYAINTPLYYPDNISKRVNFFAYYPYASVAGTELSLVKIKDASVEANYKALPYVLPSDQTNNIAASDLMCATKQTNKSKTSPVETFSFYHKLSLVTIIINNTIAFNGKQLTMTQLTGNKITSDGTLNIDDGTITKGTQTFSPFNSTSYTLTSGTKRYIDFIINPCIISNSVTEDDMRLILTIASKTYSIPIKPSTSTFEFKQGYRHNITINLSTVL